MKKSLFPKGLKRFFILCILVFTLSLFAPDDKISVAALAIARLLHICDIMTHYAPVARVFKEHSHATFRTLRNGSMFLSVNLTHKK